MEPRGAQTRQAIIESALRLFAEQGLSGVSVRMIARTAGVNVAAISYYFGSKEELYFEVIRHVFHDSGADLTAEFISEVESATSREELLDLLARLIRVKTRAFLDDEDGDERYKRLISLRVFLDDELARRMIDEFREEHEAQVLLFRKLNPGLCRLRAEVAVFSMIGQLAFYVFSRAAVVGTLGVDSYDDTIRAEVERMIYWNLTVPLNLPSKD